MFRQRAQAPGLQASETGYVRRTRSGTGDLQFSKSGDPGIEKSYRTHYLSPVLSEREREHLKEKLSQAAHPIVSQLVRDSRCSECDSEIERDAFLLMEAEQPLRLPCAHLDDLEYLPSGNAALTRCAAKYSGRTAVALRFSPTRGRYESQGIGLHGGCR